LAIYLSPPIAFGEPVVLFGRDWACFDQRKWPITACGAVAAGAGG
jgi:hypothetical protein